MVRVAGNECGNHALQFLDLDRGGFCRERPQCVKNYSSMKSDPVLDLIAELIQIGKLGHCFCRRRLLEKYEIPCVFEGYSVSAHQKT